MVKIIKESINDLDKREIIEEIYGSSVSDEVEEVQDYIDEFMEDLGLEDFDELSEDQVDKLYSELMSEYKSVVNEVIEGCC